MARNKEAKSTPVAEGFDFSNTVEEEPEIKIEKTEVKEPDSAEKKLQDDSRTYSKYYKPHPKKGAKGGALGKPAVDEKERKRSVSIQLSNNQKERYNKAAANDRRKWPDFVVAAIEEYIENHNLE